MELTYISKLVSFSSGDSHYERAKRCAIIHVKGIIEEYTTLPHFGELYGENIYNWNEILEEINKL